jgi:hypothetical protein
MVRFAVSRDENEQSVLALQGSFGISKWTWKQRKCNKAMFMGVSGDLGKL